MRKVASLLLIFTLVFALGVSAFADGDPGRSTPLRDARSTVPHSSHNYDDFQVFDDGGIQVFDDGGFVGIAPMISVISDTQLSIGPGEMFLVDNGRIVMPEARLTPNREYSFEIWFNGTNAAITFNYAGPSPDTLGGVAGLVRLTEEHISGGVGENLNGRLRLRSGRGSNMFSRSELRTRGTGPSRVYSLLLETRENYTTRMTDVTFTLLTSGNLPAVIGTSYNPQQSVIDLTVGWARMSDDEIDSYAEGDTVTLSNDYPVILRRQIERLVRNHNYRAIHLIAEDGSWEYTGRMSGMSDTNFYTTQDVIPALMNRFDQDFKFLSLPGGVTFPTNGEMRIDVSDVSGDWDRIYTYLYRNGQLTPINTNYDSMDDMIYFRTNFLGAFVMTDVEITDLALIAPPGTGVQEPEEPEEPNLHNPPTGAAAAGVNGLVMGIGTLSLLGAGAAFIRRRK